MKIHQLPHNTTKKNQSSQSNKYLKIKIINFNNTVDDDSGRGVDDREDVVADDLLGGVGVGDRFDHNVASPVFNLFLCFCGEI